MARVQRLLEHSNDWAQVGQPALTVLFGMQALRTLLPLLIFVLRDRMGWSAIQVGQLVFAIFLVSFLAAALRRLVGPRRLLVLTTGGLGLLRLVLQLWVGDPLVDLYLAIAATILFVLSLPSYLGDIRSGGVAGTRSFALGLLIGFALDTALHGAYNTYDMVWRADVGTALFTLLLVLAQWWLLLGLLTVRADATPSDGDTSFRLALTWLAFGPFLMLQLLVFQNIARLTALTGWRQPLVAGWAVLSHVLGVGTATWLLNHRQRTSWIGTALLGLMLFATLLPAWPSGTLAAFLFLVGQVIIAPLLTLIVAGIGGGNGQAGLTRITVSHGLGMLLMAILLFLYYSGFDIALPFRNTILPPIATLIVGLAAVGATRALSGEKTAPNGDWCSALLTLLLLLLPLFKLATWQSVIPSIGDGFPTRVMTYNLHNGFDPHGYLGMEAIAQAIEAQEPDVLAVQEVSRGWVIAGALDMLVWLSQRLEMPYLYGPTADPLWGNAILSRYPIVKHETVDLPPDGLLIRRGFIWARLDVGNNQHLDIIATHYHHPRDGSAIRVAQSQALLGFWQGGERTAIVGDLNAQPGDGEVEMLRQAGVSDALDLAGITPGYTFPASEPSRRIDYIWLSSDLRASDVAIVTDTVSDHLGIAATVEVMAQ